MKTILVVSMLCCCAGIQISCQTKPVESAALPDPVVLPMEMTYKGNMALGDMNNVKTVMEFNKRLTELNGDVADLLADTVTFRFDDGTEFIDMSRDSALAIINGFLGSVTEINVVFNKVIPIDNTDMKHQWVLSWTDEQYTFKDGKQEHKFLQETIRIKDGKIREALQFSRRAPLKK
jgi:hypothetical protein